MIETVHKSWHTGPPVVKWTNPSTKDISLPIVVRLGSGLLEILDVIVPGLVVLSGDGKEKKKLTYSRNNKKKILQRGTEWPF